MCVREQFLADSSLITSTFLPVPQWTYYNRLLIQQYDNLANISVMYRQTIYLEPKRQHIR